MSSDQSPGESILRRLWQVILTYTQVWAFRIQVPVLILYVIAARWVHPQSMVARGGWGLFAIQQVVMLTVMVADHLKTQLDDWRSALTPGFRWPHVAVATAFAGIPLLIVPTFLKGTLAVSGQGLAALTILVSAILAWPVYSPFLSIVVGMSLVMFKGGNSDIFITDLMAGKLAAISTGMIGFGASAMVLLWILLARLNGQTSINRLGPGNVRFRQSMTMNPRNERPGKIGSFIEGLMEKISGIPSPFVFHQNDSRARVRQRRVVTAGITPPWFTGASYVLLFTAVILFVDAAVFLGTGYSLPSQVLRGMCLMLILVEPWFFAIALTQRWPLLARESLLPASRAEFAFETGWASFQDLLESWVTCTTVALLIIFAWSPEDFIRQIGDIGWVIIYAAAALIFVFGISIWFMRFRHRWVSFLGLMLCLPIVTVPVLITFGREPRNAFHLDRTVAAISILGLCLTGMLLIVDAYHRWYRTELD